MVRFVANLYVSGPNKLGGVEMRLWWDLRKYVSWSDW